MAVKVKLTSLSDEQKKKIMADLTHTYKETSLMKSGKEAAPAKVKCYTTGKVYVYIPCFYAWTNMRLINNYYTDKRKYEATLSPRDNKQSDELSTVIDLVTKKRTVALTLRTGAGKTAVALFCACHFKEFTVVLVHIKDHCVQWANSIKKYTTANAQIVDTKMNGVHQETDILICLYTRWHLVPKVVRQDVGLLLIDECDEFCNAGGMEAVSSFCPLRTMGLTATFERPGTGLHTAMNTTLGHTYITREFDVKFTVTKVCTGIEGERIDSRYTHGCDWLHLKQSLLYNEKRNNLIAYRTKKRLKDGYKILILCSEVKHILLLQQLLTGYEIDCDVLHGNMKQYRDSDVLIGCTKKCGRGFDEESFCDTWNGVRINCVMIVDYVNNSANLIQWIGRAFRALKPIIDHFVDDDKTVEKQWCKMYEEVYKPLEANIKYVTYTA